MGDARAWVALFVLGLALRLGFYFGLPEVNDWDPAYYRHIALRLLDGHTTTNVVWSYASPPATLEHPIDLHWMPLPSRILLPFLWLWPRFGDHALSMSLGAAWGPMAFTLARWMGADARERWLAGLFGAFGFAWIWQSAWPDAIALSGALGGWLALSLHRGRTIQAALAAAAFALTRGDGFLLAPLLLLSWPDRRGALAAGAGLAAWASWSARCALVGGPGWSTARSLAANALDRDAFVLGRHAPLGWTERAQHLLSAELGPIALFMVFVLPLPALLALLPRAREPWLRGLLAYWLLMPPLVHFLVPGLVEGGTAVRSGASLVVLASAGFALGLGAVGRWSSRVRGYHPAFLPTLGLVGWVLFSWVTVPLRSLAAGPLPAACDVGLPNDVPAFSAEPLLTMGRCGRPGALLHKGMSRAELDAAATRYDLRWAIAAPESTSAAFDRDELRAFLVDWRETHTGVFERPDR
jgi:hypothetical protein